MADASRVDRASEAERRRNRTYQRMGCMRLPVLKTGSATRPVPPRGAG